MIDASLVVILIDVLLVCYWWFCIHVAFGIVLLLLLLLVFLARAFLALNRERTKAATDFSSEERIRGFVAGSQALYDEMINIKWLNTFLM